MNSIYRNFRRWWQPPRNIAEREAHRQVTFLELFYDLVYVVLIAELTHALAEHIDLEHLANFAFLFVLVWWAWLNGTTYHDIHGNNDIRTRVFTFLQMFSVAAMAVFAHNALGDGSIGFALSYATFQLILTYLWWRTGVHDPNHRPLSQPYTFAFLINTALFFISVFVPAPLRFYLWGLATLIALCLPLVIFRLGGNNPQVQTQIDLSTTATPSLVERFGLFTIIVLGEVIVGVVQGVAGHHDLSLIVGGIAALGMVIAIGQWWLYFDFISHRIPKPGVKLLLIWMYTHLPLTIGIATTGAAILNVVENVGEALPIEVRWLLVATISVSLASIAILIFTVQVQPNEGRTHRIGQIAMVVSAILIAALGLTGLEPIQLLIAIVLLMITPLLVGFLSWVRQLEPETESPAS